MRRKGRFTVILLFVLTPSVAAQTAYLVDDLNTFEGARSSAPVSLFMSVGGRVLFTAPSATAGDEVWASDGTPSGTELLIDHCPGRCSFPTREIGTMAGLAFWFDAQSTATASLIRSDGTRSGTYEIAGPNRGLSFEGSPYPHPPLILGNRIIFPGCTASHGCELWRSDGTWQGTALIHDLRSGADGSSPELLTAAGGKVFFFAYGASGSGLYVSDGTSSGTRFLHDLHGTIFASDLSSPVGVGGRAFFFRIGPFLNGPELWTSDGTPAGTKLVKSFQVTPFSNPPWLEAAKDGVLFAADDGMHGPQIWRSDGTPAGTVRLTDFGPPSSGYITSHMIEEINGRLVILARDRGGSEGLWAVSNGHPKLLLPGCGPCFSWLRRVGDRVLVRRSVDGVGDELWSTDGAPEGTIRLATVHPETGSSGIGGSPVLDGGFFPVLDASGWSMWRTDGTAAGTRRAAPFPKGAFPNWGEVIAVGKRVFLGLHHEDGSAGLWVSDGTAAGTRPVATVFASLPSSAPAQLVAAGDRLFFTARKGIFAGADSDPRQIWTSQGSAETTLPLTHLTSTFSLGPEQLTPLGDDLFFTVHTYDPLEARPLWRSDGTVTGTFALRAEQRIAKGLAAWRGFLHYTLDDDESKEIWKSDGTPEGTVPAFALPTEVSEARHLTAVGDELYFVALGTDGEEAWRSDGTTAGTRKVTDFARGPAFAYVEPSFTRFAGQIYFIADGGHGAELWTTSGVLGTTRQVVPGAPLADPHHLTIGRASLYFIASAGLWKTDGTVEGTVLLHRFEFHPLPRETELAAMGDGLVFIAGDRDHGRELWVSDGTPQGTKLLADILPGPASSNLSWLTVAGNKVYFAAADGVHGLELWESDGTAAGTRLIHDIAPGAASGLPEQLMALGNRLYFSADDGVVGQELWALDHTAPRGTCAPSPTALCLGGRFRVEAVWHAQSRSGIGHTIPVTADTGAFWFFAPENVEVILKVLDGRGLNQHHWVFYGALSSVEYALTVTDTQTGLTSRYWNSSGQLASVADTTGFGPLGAFSIVERSTSGPPPRARSLQAAAGPCVPSPARLCLNGGRFAVEATWKDFHGNAGVGTAVALTGDTGYFWFFGADNVEVVLKVLDGTALNGKHWVFYGALSSVEYTLRVTDTATGKVKTYTNPSGNLASVADTGAF